MHENLKWQVIYLLLSLLQIADLDKIGITDFFDLTPSAAAIKESVGTLSSIDECCGYKYQILDKFCANKGVVNTRTRTRFSMLKICTVLC